MQALMVIMESEKMVYYFEVALDKTIV